MQIYQGTSAAGKLVYQLSGSKTVRNEELNVTMDPSNYGTATKPHGYRKSQGRSALAERPSFRSGVLECPIAAGLYIKFTSDSRAVDLQGFNAAYYVTRVTDGTAISASQVEPERSDWSVRPYCGTLPLSSDFLIRCWIIPTRATDTSALVPVVVESACGESCAQDCTSATTLTARFGVVKDGSAFK